VGPLASPFKYHTKVFLGNLRIFKLERPMAGGKYFRRGISEFNKVVPKEEIILEAYCFCELAKKEIFPHWS